VAGLRHAADVLHGGWLPYHFAPLPINVFWTSLVLWDALSAALLWRWPRLGLPFGVVVMLIDVGVNGWWAGKTGIVGQLGVWTLMAQAAFLGLLVGLLAAKVHASPHQQKAPAQKQGPGLKNEA
jgi:hypothetical protein